MFGYLREIPGRSHSAGKRRPPRCKPPGDAYSKKRPRPRANIPKTVSHKGPGRRGHFTFRAQRAVPLPRLQRLFAGIQRVEQPRDAHIAAGVHERADHFLARVARLQRALHMAFQLHFRAAQRRQQHHGQQFAGLAVQAGAGVKIAKAQLSQKAGHGFVKGFRQPGVAGGDLVPVQGRLDRQAFLIPLVLALAGQRRLAGQRQLDAALGEHLVHRTDGVERLGETDKRRALINGLPNFHRRAPGVEAGPHMGFELGQGAEGRQYRDRDQLPHSVIKAAGVADIPKDIALQDLHERAIGAFVPGGVAVEQLLHFLFGSFFTVHTMPSFLISKALRPLFERFCRGVPIEQTACHDLGAGAAGGKLCGRLPQTAAAGSGKQDDGLPGEIIAFQKGADDMGRGVPPDGEPQVDAVIARHIRRMVRQRRAGGRVVHLHRTAGAFVLPVQIGAGVGFGGLDLIQVAAGRGRQLFRHTPGHAAGREISHQCFAHKFQPPYFFEHLRGRVLLFCFHYRRTPV